MAGIDLLNLQPSVISKDISGKYILLAGAPKIGKTEFCSLAPDALILAFEKGTNARPNVYAQPIEKWSDLKQVLRQLEKPEVKEKFKTICIDTVGIMYDLCEKFICAQNGVQKISDIPYGGGYSALSKEFEETLRRITMMGYGIIMTSHLKESIDSEGHIVGAVPDLNNRCLKIVNGLVDVIAVIVLNWNEKGEAERWVLTRSTPTITAGSRFRFLAPKIPFGYDEFVKALAEAIEQEEKLGATVVDRIDHTTEEELDFSSLREEAAMLWRKLVDKDPSNADKILKKVEINFGRKLKLSEITEDQKEPFFLVLLDMREMASNL